MNKYEQQRRLKALAFRIATLTDSLPKNQMGRYFHNQLIRSGFSAAANYRAACIAQSRAAFVAKLSIAFEESDESVFWLECIQHASLINSTDLIPVLNEATEVAKTLAAARKNAQ
ncbi:MAG: four helix bundle protein [Bacteroidetes bacterium]|nr:four helix bundle protein [Bacteroidota bacterium]